MKYGDLFTLNPIETVIQLEEANQSKEAQRLVSSFVVTEKLGQQITDVAIPQFNMDNSVEGKGLFVVGNYGTGKSHLMSFLSAIAEDKANLACIRDKAWGEKLNSFAGKYIVQRCQISGAMMTFHDIIVEQLTRIANRCGFKFTFKRQDQIINVKEEYQRYMEAFEEAQPDKGVMIIIDELLQYLRTKSDQSLIADLAILQSLGEFSKSPKFVFIAGIQQSLFNNPHFNHMSSEILKIKQRYNDFIIDTESVSQLIEQYLFAKTNEQKQQIRKLYEPLADEYEIISEKINQFVDLFPAHPDFVDEFQKVILVERREILRTLSKQAKDLLNKDISSETIDPITADDYWLDVMEDQGLNANLDVKKVKDCIKTIDTKIDSDFGLNDDKDTAHRAVHALAVNRLTTPGITDEVGLTPKEIKNKLLLRPKVAMKIADFITQAIKLVLDKTKLASNGQFITSTSDNVNAQYFIAPHINRDYDVEVDKYSESLSRDVPQRYLNELFTRAVELNNVQPIISNRLWEYNSLTWKEKNVARPGWLFFGYPNQRSTANPPKDFYLFIIPTKQLNEIEEQWPDQPDESYWFIENYSDDFIPKLKKYASARELAMQSRSSERDAFNNIAERGLSELTNLFQNNAHQWITIRWNNQTKIFGDWVAELTPGAMKSMFKTKLEAISEVMFAPHFEQKYPHYPAFQFSVNENNRPGDAKSALEIICKVGAKTENGWQVLQSLGLYENRIPTPDQSLWIQKLRQELKELGPGKVINHSDLFELRDDKVYMKGESIEAEWLQVVLAAGVEFGEWVVFSNGNTKYDATNLNEYYRNVDAYDKIIRIALPSDIPLADWRKLFQLMGVNMGLLASQQTYTEGLTEFQIKLSEKIKQLVETQSKLNQNLPFYQPQSANTGIADLSPYKAAQEIMETLQPLNSKAKMINLKLTASDIEALKTRFEDCNSRSNILEFILSESIQFNALQRYEDILNGNAEFISALNELKAKMESVYNDPKQADIESAKKQLDSTTDAALNTYQNLKKRYTLDKDGDTRKKAIIEGATLKSLNHLAKISIFNRTKFEEVRTRLGNIKISKSCTNEELLKSPTSLCPQTKFDPRDIEPNSPPALDQLNNCESEINTLFDNWLKQLKKDLSDPSISSTLGALKPADRQVVDAFIGGEKLPDKLDDFVRVMNEALKGLKTRPIKPKDIVKAIFKDGAPLKEDELKRNFDAWVKTLLGTDTADTVRFILEDEE